MRLSREVERPSRLEAEAESCEGVIRGLDSVDS